MDGGLAEPGKFDIHNIVEQGVMTRNENVRVRGVSPYVSVFGTKRPARPGYATCNLPLRKSASDLCWTFKYGPCRFLAFLP